MPETDTLRDSLALLCRNVLDMNGDTYAVMRDRIDKATPCTAFVDMDALLRKRAGDVADALDMIRNVRARTVTVKEREKNFGTWTMPVRKIFCPRFLWSTRTLPGDFPAMPQALIRPNGDGSRLLPPAEPPDPLDVERSTRVLPGTPRDVLQTIASEAGWPALALDEQDEADASFWLAVLAVFYESMLLPQSTERIETVHEERATVMLSKALRTKHVRFQGDVIDQTGRVLAAAMRSIGIRSTSKVVKGTARGYRREDVEAGIAEFFPDAFADWKASREPLERFDSVEEDPDFQEVKRLLEADRAARNTGTAVH
jgi:hypothetical protein